MLAKYNLMKYLFSILGRLVPVILSYLLLAAHFSRNNVYTLAILSLGLLVLLLIRKPWVVIISQAALLLGALEWIRSMFGYISKRQATGEDWGRLAIILSIVALFTGLSALMFRTRKLRAHYQC